MFVQIRSLEYAPIRMPIDRPQVQLFIVVLIWAGPRRRIPARKLWFCVHPPWNWRRFGKIYCKGKCKWGFAILLHLGVHFLPSKAVACGEFERIKLFGRKIDTQLLKLLPNNYLENFKQEWKYDKNINHNIHIATYTMPITTNNSTEKQVWFFSV